MLYTVRQDWWSDEQFAGGIGNVVFMSCQITIDPKRGMLYLKRHPKPGSPAAAPAPTADTFKEARSPTTAPE